MRYVLSLFLFRKLPTWHLVIGTVVFITVLAGLVRLYRGGRFPFLNRVAERRVGSSASFAGNSRVAERFPELPADTAAIPRSAAAVREEMHRLADWLRRRFPDAADAGIIAGRLEYHLGEMDAAEDAFQSVLRLDPDNAHAHHGLALIDVARSRFEQAVPHFRRVIALSPGAIGPMLELADALIRMGRIDEAVDLLEKDFPSEVESVWRAQMLGQCYLRRGDLRRARMMYELALILEPDDPVALAGLATVFSRLQDHQQTAKFTERLRKVREREREAAQQTRKVHDDTASFAHKLAEAYTMAGRLCAVHGEGRVAERLLHRALALRPDNWEAHRDLAELYLKRTDRLNDAIAHAEAAAAASPSAATSFLLARSYRAAGRSKEALDAVRRALAFGERRPEAMALYRQLTEDREQNAPGASAPKLSSGSYKRP
ncbi:MAG: tetratricopeptide repeat protein [Thermogutta sp.]|nr:tetratricopeptide repeat protein [Thermogutta sp.]